MRDPAEQLSLSDVPSGLVTKSGRIQIPRIRIEDGETEGVTYQGERVRRPTVLIKFGDFSLSKNAFILGTMLAGCQLVDGALTYLGLSQRGVHMEGNVFLRNLMQVYGATAVLFFAKLFALCAVVGLTLYAHKRRWMRPLIAALVAIYLALAIIPWVYILSSWHAQEGNNALEQQQPKG